MEPGGEVHLSVINTFLKPFPNQEWLILPRKGGFPVFPPLIIIKFLVCHRFIPTAACALLSRVSLLTGHFEMPLMWGPGSIPDSYVTQEQGGLCRQGGGSSEEMPIFTDFSLNNFNKLPCSSHTMAHGPVFCGSSSCLPSPRSLLVPNLYQPHIRHGLDPDPSSFWPLYRTKPPLASTTIILIAY